MIKALLFFLISSLCSFSQTKAPLGLPETLEDLYIPGPKIEVIPRTNNDSPLVIRILKIKPAENGFRYDLEIYALDPGTHRISEFLRYATDQSPVQSLDATFEVTTTHPLDTLPKPSARTCRTRETWWLSRPHHRSGNLLAFDLPRHHLLPQKTSG